MSGKAIFWFSVWTSAFSALFYHVYNLLPFGIGWVMFVCLGVFFGMGLKPKDTPALLISAYSGMAWGQFDFFLIFLFGLMGMGTAASTFVSILVGTTVTMCIHLGPLSKTPLRHMPIIFAGVCLTFSQGGKNILGLAVTFAFGLALCAVCCAGQMWFMKLFPKKEADSDEPDEIAGIPKDAPIRKAARKLSGRVSEN